MELTTWLSLVVVCTLGAMSPGPSIALIIDITAKGGRQHGVVAAIAHGLGVGCYALLAAAGLAVVVQQSSLLFSLLQFMGAAFLAYLGLKALGFNVAIKRNKAATSSSEQPHSTTPTNYRSSFVVGFLTAILNPKVALFFLALFSQFVSPDAGLLEKIVMGSTAAGIDTLWYVLVALLTSNTTVAKHFAGSGKWLQKGFGVLLIGVAIRIVFTA
jgi:threonine/homoserine/homoserine lactone efflux protein